MTIFSQLAATARAAHAHFFGGSVSLIAYPGAVATNVDAVLGTERIETRREDNRDVRYFVRECRFRDLTTIRHDAIITVGTLNYSIDHELARQGSGITVQLRRTTLVDANRPNYRGKG